MEINLRGLDTQMQPNQLVIKEGLWSGTGIVDGGQGRSVGIREAIQRELEKERIREEILAEEVARKRVLEAEVRREIMMEMAMYGDRGFPSSLIMLGSSPIIYNNRLDPGMPHGQPSKRVLFEMKSGGHHREIGGVELVPFRPPIKSQGEGKQKFTDLPDGPTNWKPPPQPAAAGGSSGIKHCSGGGEIGLGVAPKKFVKKQPLSIKNSRKCVSNDSKKEDKKTELSLWCSMCGVGASSEIVMIQHKEGKKHMKNLEKLNREAREHGALGVRKRSSGMKPNKTRRKQKSHKAARNR